MEPPTRGIVADDMEGRMRECERSVDRLDGRLGRVEEEMKQFRPIPLENAEYRTETRGNIKGLADDVHEAFDGIRRIEQEFKEYVAEQVKIREAREERERLREEADRAREKADRQREKERDETRAKETQTQRTMLKVAAFGLLGTFLTSTAAVLAAVLGGGP